MSIKPVPLAISWLMMTLQSASRIEDGPILRSIRLGSISWSAAMFERTKLMASCRKGRRDMDDDRKQDRARNGGGGSELRLATLQDDRALRIACGRTCLLPNGFP